MSDEKNHDENLCLCFHVSQRKIVNYCKRERPKFASLISECLSAGTGCGWCIPFIKSIHQNVIDGKEDPYLPFNPTEYADKRANFRSSGEREDIELIEPGQNESGE